MGIPRRKKPFCGRIFLSELPLSEIEEVLQSGENTQGISFSDLLRQVLDTEQEVDKKELVKKLVGLAFGDLAECKGYFSNT